MRSVVSGLNAWHGFAEVALYHPSAATLPPRTDADICRFISIFTTAGTAANHVGYVTRACVNFNLSCAWWKEIVTLTSKRRICVHVKALHLQRFCSQILGCSGCMPGRQQRSHTCSSGFSCVFGISCACSKRNFEVGAWCPS